ncbi:hypothetical protein [Pseudomonas sp. GXZC]|uniref:hypothetical protein n=1 Tax=Pseudomonas sp. GXZC TaxID=3003351 RepID=UPI0022AA29C1|nr:hypothetical protein [Pseudomonas sp. GXZC]WAT32110.1 hypothetical protein OZ428_34175 [Pseudomonas sp. GXZC]
MAIPALGVVILDDKRYPATSAGYAVTAEGGRRINRLSDLASGVVWYTSVGYAEFKRGQLYKQSNLRGDQLLRCSMSSIIHEIGLEYAPIPEQAEAVFRVFQEIAGYLEANLGWNGKVFGRLDWYLNNFLGIASRQTAGSPLITAARNAHEYMTPAMVQSNPDATSRTYIAPRIPYLQALMTLPVPHLRADWTYQPLSGQADSNRLAAEGGLGSFFEVSISDIDPDLAVVAPFAARQTTDSDPRVWCALPEAMFYADRSNLVVRGVWKPSRVESLGEQLAAASSNGMKLVPDCDFSYSAGLIAESLLYAILGTTSGDKPATGREPVAAYVAAHDRLMMIRHAQKVYDAGYTPMSSACGGRLVVSLPAMAIADLDSLCQGMGLEAPMTGS